MKEKDFQSLIDQGQLPAFKAPPPMGNHLFEEKSPQIDFGFLDHQWLSEKQDAAIHHSELQKWIALNSSETNDDKIQEPPSDPIEDLVARVMGKLDQKPNLTDFSASPRKENLNPSLQTQEASVTRLTLPAIQGHAQAQGIPGLAGKVSCMSQLVDSILNELSACKRHLLELNPSRREHLLNYLNVLCGTQSLHHRYADNAQEIKESLRRWIETPANAAQEAALKTFFEEVALVFLAQALLLKAWSDRGVRPWSRADLSQLNWVLAKVLSPHVPNCRDAGWRITKANLYTWYRPGESVREKIFLSLSEWKLDDEGPEFIARLLRHCRRYIPNMPELRAYDERFYSVLWEKISLFGFNIEASGEKQFLRRRKRVFSPTLRDGLLIRSMPGTAENLEWIGLELNPFQMIILELGKLWLGPSAPPLWSPGSGLEVHNREQLSMEWKSRQPSVESQISEMEACDLSFVFEERSIRTHGRSPQAAFLRSTIEQLPYFKNLKSNGTTLGDLQACVALSKLRQGGLLWWTRHERLGTEDGQSILDFLLEKSKILCEWDFSGLESAMPQSHSDLFPQYLYLFQREGDLNRRSEHFPQQIRVYGTLKSHIEVPVVLSDAFESAKGNVPIRGNWKIQSRKSPSPQREWHHHWPEAGNNQMLERLENYKNRSEILGNFTTVRSLKGSAKENKSKGRLNLPPAIRVAVQHDAGKNFLTATLLPQDHYPSPSSASQAKWEYLITVPDKRWAAPLSSYLGSPIVSHWLDHFSEKKKGRWIISEASLKYIPVPHRLVEELKRQRPLESTELRELINDLPYHPEKTLDYLKEHPRFGQGPDAASLYVATSQALHDCRKDQDKLFSIVSPEGKIVWQQLIQVLPESHRLIFSVHPQIKLSGHLPPQIPITSIRRHSPGQNGEVTVGATTLVFSNEKGLHVQVGSSNSALLDILWTQVKDLNQPTWGELTQDIFLPRELDFARNVAKQILQVHEVQLKQCDKYNQILNSCLDF